MDGVNYNIGGASAPNITSPVSSLATATPSPQAAIGQPAMAAKIGSPVAATTAATNALSPNIKASIVAAGTGNTSSVPTPALITGSPSTHTGRPGTGSTDIKVLDKKRLQDLMKEVDPLEQMDDDVEEMLMQIADDFIDNVVSASCQIAKHRKSNTVEVKDVQLHLERNWNMWIPGFGAEDLKVYKKSATTDAHKQRLALIKKTLKKY